MPFKVINQPAELIDLLENWVSFDGSGTEYDYVSLVHIFQSCLKGILKGQFSDYEYEAFSRFLSHAEKQELTKIAAIANTPVSDEDEN